MNMEFLYREMKAVLDFFGLRFRDMSKVEISTKDGCIVFEHEGRTTSLELPK